MLNKKLLIACILGAAVPVFAQLPSDPTMLDLTRRELQARRQVIIERSIQLTDEQRQPFWDLYRDWRAKSAGIGDRILELIYQLDESAKLTDAQAKTLIDDWLELERDRVNLREAYVKRFRKILPEKTVAQFFQLESKMDAIIDYDLVWRTPMIE